MDPICKHIIEQLFHIAELKDWDCVQQGDKLHNHTYQWDAYQLVITSQDPAGAKLVLWYADKVVLIVGVTDVEHFNTCVIPALIAL